MELPVSFEVDEQFQEQVKAFLDLTFGEAKGPEGIEGMNHLIQTMRPLAIKMAVEVTAAQVSGRVTESLAEAAATQAVAEVFIQGQPVEFDAGDGCYYQRMPGGGRLRITSADAERIENWRKEGISDAAIDEYLRIT